MNTLYKLNVVQEKVWKNAGRVPVFARHHLLRFVVISLIVLGLGSYLLRLAPQMTKATVPEYTALDLFELAANGQGDAAVQDLAALAETRGGWGPAPGDETAFAPTMRLAVASTVAIDEPPQDCTIPDRTQPRNPDCGRDFQRDQNLVSFGPETFEMMRRNGTSAPRATVDDILSVYIEEVGHSWQEYCYETEGRCQGERTRITTWIEGKQQAAGWEYQTKMYILSLDGTLLKLSSGERAQLSSSICAGYADPRYTGVSAYGPPPGWPNPAGWPTTTPTQEQFQAFCQHG
jgi:hypothetical protein